MSDKKPENKAKDAREQKVQQQQATGHVATGHTQPTGKNPGGPPQKRQDQSQQKPPSGKDQGSAQSATKQGQENGRYTETTEQRDADRKVGQSDVDFDRDEVSTDTKEAQYLGTPGQKPRQDGQIAVGQNQGGQNQNRPADRSNGSTNER